MGTPVKLSDLDMINHGPELSEEVNSLILEKYETTTEILEASMTQLKEIEGVGPSTAIKLQRFAEQAEKEASGTKSGKTDKRRKQESVIGDRPLFDRELTKEEKLRLQNQEEEALEPEKEYVLLETPVDKFFKLRTRLEIGPSTCRECGFDVIKTNDLPAWNDLSDIDKSRVSKTLEHHVKSYHSSPSNKRILSESEMSQTNWTKPVTIKP